jgi:Tfp pilus assembly PilM family ATPase
LKELIEEKLAISAEIFDPFEGLMIDESTVLPEYVKNYGTAATVVAGLAMRKPGDK